MGTIGRSGWLAALMLLVASQVAWARPRARDDAAAVAAFLTRAHPGSHWQNGPTAVDSDEIRAAWPGRRFYFVRSMPPVPPGRPEGQGAFQKAVEEYNARHYISAVVAIDKKGRITELTGPAGYNAGLMKVDGEGDARTVAAAIFTVVGVGFTVGPVVITAAEVTLEQNDTGFAVSIQRAYANSYLELDRRGRLTRVPQVPPMPVPPAAFGGRPFPH